MQFSFWQRLFLTVLTLGATPFLFAMLFQPYPSGSHSVVLLFALPSNILLSLPSFWKSLQHSEDAHEWFAVYWPEAILLVLGLLVTMITPIHGVVLLLLRQWIVVIRSFLSGRTVTASLDLTFKVWPYLGGAFFVLLGFLYGQMPANSRTLLQSLWLHIGQQLGISSSSFWLWGGSLLVAFLVFWRLYKGMKSLLWEVEESLARLWSLGVVSLLALQPWFWKSVFVGSSTFVLFALLWEWFWNEALYLKKPSLFRAVWGGVVGGVLAILLPGGLWLILCFGLWRAWLLRKQLLETMLVEGARWRVGGEAFAALLTASALPVLWEKLHPGFALQLPIKALQGMIREPVYWSNWLGSFLVMDVNSGSGWMYRCSLQSSTIRPCLTGGLPDGWIWIRLLSALLMVAALLLMLRARKTRQSKAWLLLVVFCSVGLAVTPLTSKQDAGLVTLVLFPFLLLLPSLGWQTLSRRWQVTALFVLGLCVFARVPAQFVEARKQGLVLQQQKQKLSEIRAWLRAQPLQRQFPLLVVNKPHWVGKLPFVKVVSSNQGVQSAVDPMAKRIFDTVGRLQPELNWQKASFLKKWEKNSFYWLVPYTGAPLMHRWQLRSRGLNPKERALYWRWKPRLELLQRYTTKDGKQWLLFLRRTPDRKVTANLP